MVADRQTVIANFRDHLFILSAEEAMEYSDLAELIRDLRLICPKSIVDLASGGPLDIEELSVTSTINTGRAFDASRRIVKEMTERECHDNVIQLVGSRPELRAFRGWALEKDKFRIQGCLLSIWKAHSWAWDPRTEKIIETTPVSWCQYFGRDITNRIRASTIKAENTK